MTHTIILNHIKELLTPIVSIKTIDFFLNQETEQEGMSATPCTVLIKMHDFPVKKLSKFRQETTINFTVHIYTKFSNSTSTLNEHPVHEAIHQDVIKKLFFYDLTNESPYIKIKGLHKTTCSFTRTIIGLAARKTLTVHPTASIEPEITTNQVT